MVMRLQTKALELFAFVVVTLLVVYRVADCTQLAQLSSDSDWPARTETGPIHSHSLDHSPGRVRHVLRSTPSCSWQQQRGLSPPSQSSCPRHAVFWPAHRLCSAK
jgi:hypothetical protein